MQRKSDLLLELITSLLQHQKEFSVSQVAKIAGLSGSEAHRKLIRRTLLHLVDKGILVPKGNARSRTYVAVSEGASSSEESKTLKEFSPRGSLGTSEESESLSTFPEIFLSQESQTLLRLVSRPLQSRKPTGYDVTFLSDYIPNKTLYFSNEQRRKLHQIGMVENQTRPAGTYTRTILSRILIDLSWNSSRLEGNSYTLLETKRLIELGEKAAGKDTSEAQMILNHKRAIEYITDVSHNERLTSHEICSIHALLSENLLGDPGASGRLRRLAVRIGGTQYLPLDNPYILKECFSKFIDKFNAISDPFEQSFFSLLHLSYLQAFEDVNKRTARLVSNIPFVKHNLKPLSFAEVDTPIYVKALLGVYEQNDASLLRDLFLWAYERSAQLYSAIQQSMGEPNLFKLKHRDLIQTIIQSLIRKKVSGPKVVSYLRAAVKDTNLAETEKNRLFEILETEILHLHEGNIARYRILPSEFEEWQIRQ